MSGNPTYRDFGPVQLEMEKAFAKDVGAIDFQSERFHRHACCGNSPDSRLTRLPYKWNLLNSPEVPRIEGQLRRWDLERSSCYPYDHPHGLPNSRRVPSPYRIGRCNSRPCTSCAVCKSTRILSDS